MQKVIIHGCGGHAISVADVILNNFNDNCSIIFIDKNAKKNEKIMGFSVFAESPKKTADCFCGIGDNLLRRRAFLKTNFKTLISRDAFLGANNSIGAGSFIAHYAYIGPNTKIGKGCIINTNSILEHEAKVGDFSHISVNAILCGKVTIGKNVFVGAGSIIRDRVRITDDVTIGCGSVVVHDITEKGVYVGNPAKKI